MFLKVNLPGLHILEESFIPSIAEELKQSRDFFRRSTKLSKLVGAKEGPVVSSSVYNYRKKLDESNTKPPKSLFNKKQ